VCHPPVHIHYNHRHFELTQIIAYSDTILTTTIQGTELDGCIMHRVHTSHREYYKGEGGDFPQSSGRGEFYEFVCAYVSSMHQKCSNYALINMLFSLCKSIWIINTLVTCPSPHPKVIACPSSPKVLRVREHIPTPSSSIIFTFRLAFESYEEFGGVLKNANSQIEFIWRSRKFELQ
jgi:hypothetical protein